MDIEKNVGGYDRIARAVLGPVLILVAIAGLAGLLVQSPSTVLMAVFVVALVVGVILAFTAYTQQCIVNQTLGLNTLQE